ncbi:hypothetical protein HZS_1079 [Henneguya salminicola]|nr:hypothetical protein HZS_1079 [Henneguya salminicola]
MTRGSPLNNDTRVQIIESYNLGNSCQKIAEIFDHNRKTVQNVVKRYLLTGEIENKPSITSNKCMQEFGVRIFKSTATNI